MSASPPGRDRDYVHQARECFGCGPDNPAGLRLRPWREGDWVVAEYVPQGHHRGFTRVVHGGVVASVLDEVVTTAVALKLNLLVATAAIETEFLRPMRLDGRFTARARHLGEQGKYHLAEGEIRDAAGHLVARARGRFVPLTPERVARFLE